MWLNEVCLNVNVGATDHIKRQAFSGVAVPKALAGTSYPSTGPALREGAPLTDTAGGSGHGPPSVLPGFYRLSRRMVDPFAFVSVPSGLGQGLHTYTRFH